MGWQMNISIEVALNISWTPEVLPPSFVAYPEYSESLGGSATRSPEIPLYRVDADGAVAVLSYLGNRYFPAGKLSWFIRGASGGETHVQTADHPFAACGDILAVDFFVTRLFELVLLEKVASDDGKAFSRIAIFSPLGALVVAREALDGGPYERLVPDDSGLLFLLGQESGNHLRELDLQKAELGNRYVADPGSKLALEANRGTFFSRRQLDKPEVARITAPSDIPSALVRVFGVNGNDDYYVVLDAEIAVISFGGALVARIPFDGHHELATSTSAGLVARLSPPPSWQVDRAGRIYLGRVDAEGFSILRIQTD